MRKFLLPVFVVMLFIPILAVGQGPCSPGYTGDELCNAIPSFGGIPTTDVKSFVTASFTWLATIVSTLAFVMLVFSGGRMLFSQGDPTAVKQAKVSFVYSIVGFMVTIFAYVIVSMTQFFVGVKPGDPTGERGFFYNPLRDDRLFAAPGTPNFIESTVTNFLGIAGTIAMFFIVWHGFRYVMAGSNEEQNKSAKQGITWSVIGLVSILVSYTVIQVVIRTFSP